MREAFGGLGNTLCFDHECELLFVDFSLKSTQYIEGYCFKHLKPSILAVADYRCLQWHSLIFLGW